MNTSHFRGIGKAAKYFGSQLALAKALNVTPVAVNQWFRSEHAKNARPVPPKQCVRIERLTSCAVMAMLGVMGEIDGSSILSALDKVEAKLTAMSEKAEGEFKTVGKIASDTKTALDAIGVEQRVLADRLLAVEQKATAAPAADGITSWGEQFIKSARYADFAGGNLAKLRVEVKNSLVGSDSPMPNACNADLAWPTAFSTPDIAPSTVPLTSDIWLVSADMLVSI